MYFVIESRKLKDHEMNYPNHDLQLATIVYVLKMWRNYLLVRNFESRIDHDSLKYLFTQPHECKAKKVAWVSQ